MLTIGCFALSFAFKSQFLSRAHMFFIVPAVPGYQTSVCVCECTIRRRVFGWWYNQAIERQKACGGHEQRRPLLLQMCVWASVCVCMCAGGGVLRKRGGRKGKARVFWCHRQSLLWSAVPVNEDLWKVLPLWTVTLCFWEGLFMSLGLWELRAGFWTGKNDVTQPWFLLPLAEERGLSDGRARDLFLGRWQRPSATPLENCL